MTDARASGTDAVGELATRAVQSSASYAGTRLVGQVVSSLVTIVLARLLTPEDFGLFGIVIGLLAFLGLLQEMGLGVAIVQAERPSREHLTALDLAVFTGGAGMAAAVVLGAGGLAAFYADARLTWIFRTLAALLVLEALAVVPNALLARELDFRWRARAEVGGVLLFAIVAVGLAVLGAGVWALVGGRFARVAARSVILRRTCGWRRAGRGDWTRVGASLSFGFRSAAAHLVTTLSVVAGTIIIGRSLGGETLGLYLVAYAIGMDSLHKVSTALLNYPSLALFSRLQSDDGQSRAHFVRLTRYLAVLGLPLHVGLALVAADFVHVFLGEAWRPMVAPLRVFALGGLTYALTLPAVPFLLSRGRADLVLRVEAISAVLVIGVLFAGLPFGLTGLALAWLAAYLPSRACLAVIAGTRAGVALGDYVAAFAPGAAATAAMAAAVALAYALGPAVAAERLVLSVVLGGAAYLTVVTVADRRLIGELRVAFRMIAPLAGRGASRAAAR